MDILRQRPAQHVRVRLMGFLGQPFHARGAVGQRQRFILAQAFARRAAVAVLRGGQAHHAGEHQQRVGKLLLIVHAVALQQIVGVNQRQHALKIAALAGVVPVFGQGHRAEVVGDGFKRLADGGGLGAAIAGDQAIGVHVYAQPCAIAAQVGFIAHIHAKQRARQLVVAVHHKGVAGIDGDAARARVFIGIAQLCRAAEHALLHGQLRVHRGRIARPQRLAQAFDLVAGIILIPDGAADQVARGHIADIGGIAVGNARIGQPLAAFAAGDIVCAVVIGAQAGQPRAVAGVLAQHAAQQLGRGQRPRHGLRGSLNHGFLLLSFFRGMGGRRGEWGNEGYVSFLSQERNKEPVCDIKVN